MLRIPNKTIIVSSVNGSRITEYPHAENEIKYLILYHTENGLYHTQNGVDLNVRPEALKLLEKYRGNFPWD